jgi:hypothetical protein
MKIRIMLMVSIIGFTGYTLSNPKKVFSGIDTVEQKMLAARAETVYAATGMEDTIIVSKLTIDGQIEYMSRIIPIDCIEAKALINEQKALLLIDRSKAMSKSELTRTIMENCQL